MQLINTKRTSENYEIYEVNCFQNIFMKCFDLVIGKLRKNTANILEVTTFIVKMLLIKVYFSACCPLAGQAKLCEPLRERT